MLTTRCPRSQDNIAFVFDFMPSRANVCKRIEDLFRRWKTFQNAKINEQGPAASETDAAAPLNKPLLNRKSLRSSIIGSLSSNPANIVRARQASGSQVESPDDPADEQALAGGPSGRRRTSTNSSVANVGQAFSKSDFAFLALVFAILETTAEVITDAEIISLGISWNMKDILPRLSTYHRHCMTLLSMSDMLAEPTLEGIEAIQLLGQYYFNRQRRAEYTVLNTMCLRMAESMGLHKLGSARGDVARWAKKNVQPGENRSGPDHPAQMSRGENGSTQKVDAPSPTTTVKTESSTALNRTDLHGWFLPKGEHKEKWEQMNVSRWHDGDHGMRELGRKVFFQGVFVDWQLATLHDGVYHVKEGM